MLDGFKHRIPERAKSALVAGARIIDPYPYRRYMRRYGTIFVHVPKTGGTAVLEAIGERKTRMHVPWQVYWQANRYRFSAYLKFAVVRNPYDRMVSVYTYLMRGGSPRTDGKLAATLMEVAPTFDEFVTGFLTPSRLCLHNLLRPQAFYVCDVFGEVMVDQLCRFENLEADINAVLKDMGLKQRTLPKVNTSGRVRHWSSYYTPSSAARVRDLYASDFEYLGYPDAISGAPR